MAVQTVIINYQTPDLLETAVLSFKEIYPTEKLLIVDNGSQDNSIKVIKDLEVKCQNVEALFLEQNIFHGPAMDLVAREHSEDKYIFFLDSDTETTKSGFLEELQSLGDDNDKMYAFGQLLNVNKRGFKDDSGSPIIATPFLFIKREVYLQFSPFIHHGQPTLKNFSEARKAGFKLVDYPMPNFINHYWRGTASRFGYGLGIRGKLEFVLNKIGL
tara:strand:+ start:2431 stop:3075 length:645 start_codon:yes stop_codon:yes gene_type:complete